MYVVVFVLAVVSAVYFFPYLLQQYQVTGQPVIGVRPVALPGTCGNGALEGAEQCDDGALENGDGCTSTCQFEPGFVHVCSVQDLDNVRNNLTGSYIQVCDIDLTGVSFQPIGSLASLSQFKGIYNGNSFSIRHFTFLNPSKSDVGLFGVLGDNAKLFYMTLEDVSVEGDNRVGGLLGQMLGTAQVSDSQVTGNVIGNGSWIGGFAGQMSTFPTPIYSIKNARFSGTVKGAGSSSFRVGGFVGMMAEDSIVENSITDSTVSNAKDYLGGFAGSVGKNAVVRSSTATSTVTAVSSTNGAGTGGFAGTLSENARVENSVANIQTISGADAVGGFAGKISGGAKVMNGKAKGSTVIGSDDGVGGFVGRMEGGTVQNSQAIVKGVQGDDKVGGFVGDVVQTASFLQVSSSNTAFESVTGNADIGGFAGHMRNNPGLKPEIVQSISIGGTVTGNALIGGFIGAFDNDGSIKESAAKTSVSTTKDTSIGGFAGLLCTGAIFGPTSCLIEDSYAQGSVQGVGSTFSYVGGFAGRLQASASGTTTAHIKNAYAAVTVNVTGVPGTTHGGFLGVDSGDVGTYTSLHWDQSVGGTLPSCGTGICLGISPHSTSAMQQQSTYSGWDFSTTWDILDGQSYPFLEWQAGPI